jgi:hypothetical protein
LFSRYINQWQRKKCKLFNSYNSASKAVYHAIDAAQKMGNTNNNLKNGLLITVYVPKYIPVTNQSAGFQWELKPL